MGKSDPAAQVGRRIRDLRLAKGLSQVEFADIIGLDRTYVSGVERGIRNPTIRSLQRFAKGLGVSLSELFRGLQ